MRHALNSASRRLLTGSKGFAKDPNRFQMVNS